MLISWHLSTFLPDLLRSLDISDSERGKRWSCSAKRFWQVGKLLWDNCISGACAYMILNDSATSYFPIESRWRKKGLMAIRASFFLRWKVVLGKRLFNRCFIHRLIRAGSTINFHSFLALVTVTTAKSLIKCSSRLANLMLTVWIFPTGVTQICLPANAFINGLKRVSKCVCVVRFLNVSNSIWRKLVLV